jgi:AraC family transcriptional regulator
LPIRQETLECHKRAIGAVIEVARKDPSAPLDLTAMAAIASMGECHFLRVFEEVTSVSPVRFLAALRIERAKHLLLETSLSVTTICFEVGYNSLGTFTRLFTEYVGLCPGSFRRLHEELLRSPIDGMIAKYLRRQPPLCLQCAIAGSVTGPTGFQGVIFLGLFPSTMPRGWPVAGSLLPRQGRFELAGPGNSTPSCLMAAGFPADSTVTQYLLPSPNELLVDAVSLPRQFSQSPPQTIDLTLRPLGAFDPPILIALPSLLREDPYGDSQFPRSVGAAHA